MKTLPFALLVLAAAPAAAQDGSCQAAAAAPGFAGWGKPAGGAVAVGKEATLALKPATAVRFVPRLARAPKAGTFGGYFPVDVPSAGTYRIAVSDKAWIDAVHGGRRLHSAAHEHGAACTGIAKIVAFQLEAGRSYLQVSEAEKPAIGLMVVKG